MKPKRPALSEDEEEDSFDEVDCEGGYFDENEEEPEEDEFEEVDDRSDGEG